MATNPFLDCGDGWETYDGSICDSFTSGIDAAILFKVGVDKSDIFTGSEPNETIDPVKVQALLDSGDAQIINGLRIGIDAPSAQTSDSYVACAPDTVSTYSRTLTWKDRKVTGVVTRFYNSINAASGFTVGSMLLHECASDRATYINALMNFQGGRVSPEGKELQRFEFTVSWEHTDDPLPYPAAAVWDLIPASGSGS